MEKGDLDLGSQTCALWDFLYIRHLILVPVTRQDARLDTLPL